MIAQAQPPGRTEPHCSAAAEAGAMVRFTIAPDPDGAWRWRTFAANGEMRAQGLASTRKQAAALVIRNIIVTQVERLAPQIPELSAKAA